MTAPVRYLSRPQIAERWGVRPDTLNRYKLPDPDAQIGRIRGWLPRTADAWRDPFTRSQLLDTARAIQVYLNRSEVAERIGLRPQSLNHGYALPPHDGQIGKYIGWLPETVDAWRDHRS